jgi:hypothetical protein
MLQGHAELEPIVANRHEHFAAHAYVSLPQLLIEADLIGVLQQSRPEHRVDFDRGVDDLPTDNIDVHAVVSTIDASSNRQWSSASLPFLCVSAVMQFL